MTYIIYKFNIIIAYYITLNRFDCCIYIPLAELHTSKYNKEFIRFKYLLVILQT